MIYLLGSIIFASAIFLVFKLFGKYAVHNLPAIVINYFTAGVFGFFIIGAEIDWAVILQKKWLPYSIGIGAGFIFIFNLMAVTTQKLGASASSITVKMSVVIPITVAFFIYGDHISFLKIFGIMLALLGIYFSNKKDEIKEAGNKWLLLLPIILFLGGGALDTLLKYVEETFIDSESNDIMLLTPAIFISAGIFGSLTLLANGILNRTSMQIRMKEIGFGISLGLINYGSIFCLISVLNFSDWESSMVFPINNVGIVLVTVLSSVILFKEKLSKVNKLGIGISMLAILMIAIS